MSTLVLVHGAWSGGWRWQPTARALRAAGHEVYAPTLTGLGERVHLAHPRIDLDTHILDIVNLLEAEDLRDVILVGHSYGGMVITGVAERVPDRIARLIYVDAFVPNDGESLLDLLAPELRRAFDEELRLSDDGWRMYRPNDDRPRPRPAPSPRSSPQPWQTYAQPLRVANPAAASLGRTYVRATADKAPGEFMTLSFAKTYERVRAAGWPIHKVDLDHSQAASADVLLELLAPKT